MSQNTHTLHLLFKEPIALRCCQLVLQYQQAGDAPQAARWAEKLGGADPEKLWSADWFNHSMEVKGGCLLVQFDSSSSEGIPLSMLEELFAHGLQAAVAEVFYDQVGETECMHFDQGMWVARKALLERYPALKALAEAETPEQDLTEDAESAGAEEEDHQHPRKPVHIAALRAEQDERERQGQEAAQAMLNLFKDMRESGVPPVQGLMGIFLLRAGFKGLVHAALFTVVTALLFKGLWLWIGLGVVLAVVLPLYYMQQERKSLFS